MKKESLIKTSLPSNIWEGGEGRRGGESRGSKAGRKEGGKKGRKNFIIVRMKHQSFTQG